MSPLGTSARIRVWPMSMANAAIIGDMLRELVGSPGLSLARLRVLVLGTDKLEKPGLTARRFLVQIPRSARLDLPQS